MNDDQLLRTIDAIGVSDASHTAGTASRLPRHGENKTSFCAKIRLSLHSKTVPIAVVLFFVFLELFVFNLSFWQTLGNASEISNSGKLGPDMEWVGNGLARVTGTLHSYWEVSSKSPIQYFYINPSPSETSSMVVTWKLSTRGKTDSKWYTPENQLHYSPKYANSRYVHVDDGATKLRFDYDAPKGALIPIGRLTFNPKIPLRFSTVRIGIEVALASFIIAFRPGSKLYCRRFSLRDKVTDIGLVVIVALQIACVVAVWFAWGGNVTSSQPPTKVRNSIFGFDQYAWMANSIIHGHNYLDLPVNQGLAQMKNPYDWGARSRIPTGHTPIYFDTAFKNGKYYSYFGVLPALVLFVPFKLLTGTNLSTGAAVLMVNIALLFAIVFAVIELARLMMKRSYAVSSGAVLLVDSVFFLGIPILYILHSESHYQLPQTMSIALVLMAMACWFESKMRGLNKGWLGVGAFLMALTLATRPMFIFAAFLAFPLFWKEIKQLFAEGLHSKRAFLRELGVWACALLPVIVVAVPTFLYNKARFGSLFDFGANYNLTGFDMTKYKMSFSQIVPLTFMYFFQPMNLSTDFPFVQHTSIGTTRWMPLQPSLGGFFVSVAPFALAIFALFGYRKLLRRTGMTSLVIWMVVVGLVIFVIDALKVGYDSRYLLDFVWVAMLLFAITVFVVDTDREKFSDVSPSSWAGTSLKKYVLSPLSASSKRIIGWILAGVILAWWFAFFNMFGKLPSQYDERLWWNVSSWFLFV